MKVGGVSEYTAQLIELEKRLNDTFSYQERVDTTLIKGLLGLGSNPSTKLSDTERLRLTNLLRRAGKISDEELTVLGMVAIPIQDALSRAQENREHNQPPSSRYDPLPFASLHRRDW